MKMVFCCCFAVSFWFYIDVSLFGRLKCLIRGHCFAGVAVIGGPS